MVGEQDKSRIEKLKQKLYSPNSDIKYRERTSLEQKESDAPTSFEINKEEDEFLLDTPQKMSVFAKILVGSFIFFLIAIIYGGYTLFLKKNTQGGNDVNISFIGPVQISGGQKISFDIAVSNNSRETLEVVDLILDYPQGTKDPNDPSKDLTEQRISLGDIEPGSINKSTFSAILFGDQGEVKKLVAKIEYHTPSTFVLFEKQKDITVSLTDSPVRVIVDGLEEISSGQELSLNVAVSSNSNEDIPNVLLTVDYPFGFIYENSSEKNYKGNNTWFFPVLKTKEKKIINIVGTMQGQDNDQRFFKVRVSDLSASTTASTTATSTDQGIVFSNYIHSVNIKRPFVSANVLINGSLDQIVSAKNQAKIIGSIRLFNNTNDVINNANIEMVFSGKSFSKFSVTNDKGFYDSSNNKIVWNQNTFEKLKAIGARSGVDLGFSFDVLDLTQIQNLHINPEIKIDVAVKGDRIAENNLEEKIESKTSKLIRIISPLDLVANTFVKQGPFINTGPLPPKVEQETTYTIFMSATNAVNDYKDAKITAKVPLYVTWMGFHPNTENVSYNESTRTVTWNIGNLEQGAGYTKPIKSIYYQVKIFPSANQIQKAPPLLEQVLFSGEDAFTGTKVESFIKEPDTVAKDLDSEQNQITE